MLLLVPPPSILAPLSPFTARWLAGIPSVPPPVWLSPYVHTQPTSLPHHCLLAWCSLSVHVSPRNITNPWLLVPLAFVSPPPSSCAPYFPLNSSPPSSPFTGLPPSISPPPRLKVTYNPLLQPLRAGSFTITRISSTVCNSKMCPLSLQSSTLPIQRTLPLLPRKVYRKTASYSVISLQSNINVLLSSPPSTRARSVKTPSPPPRILHEPRI